MKDKNKITQFILISVGFLLILSTYFLYPKISKDKFAKDKIIEQDATETGEEKNTFENVEYKGLYDINNPFTVTSEKAQILTTDSDVVYMFGMKVVLYMSDNRIITITSKKGKYNKVTYDCYFIDNVKATDGETIIFADNMDLLATKDTAAAYNNVNITNDKGSSLNADKIDYNFETKYYKVSMFNNEKVKVKIIK